MPADNSIQPDLAALRDDLAGLKRDVAGLIDHLGRGVVAGAEKTATQIDEGARSLANDVAAGSGRTAELIGRKIEEQPLIALLIAVGVGWVGGRLMSR